MHQAVVEGVPATKRDMYYRDVPLFKNQRVVDNLVDDIAASLDLERSDLNIRATTKGIFCGSGLTINLIGDEMITGSDSEPTLIPVGDDIETFSVDDDVEWVLVVEKDAVFQTLCHHRLTALTPGKGIMITGKGYPDLATRQLVKTLSDCLPKRIPVMAFVDGDAFGIDILSVYKYGSQAMSHENDKLAASRLKWLGLWSTELSKLGIDKDALIPITPHDEKKALSLLRNKMPAKWRRELNHMLHNRRKAEIEVLTTARSLTFPRSSSLPEVAGTASILCSSFSYSAPTPCPARPFPESSLIAARPEFGLPPLLQYITFKLREVVSSASHL
ncbi:DNA topoisomerase IV, alpha subunit [Marasmius fiardii PR-910]|nr:DNA topoisomerase IV, alpha subunit [Marasmius fiardii PR-910]